MFLKLKHGYKKYFLLFPLLILFIYIAVPINRVRSGEEFKDFRCFFQYNDDTRIEFYRSRNTQNCNINDFDTLYLPGGPGDSVTFHEFQNYQRLFPDRKIAFYNDLGIGNSSRKSSKEYNLQTSLGIIEKFSNAKFTKKFTIIGGSWGAMLAARFSGNNPEKIEKLLLISPGDIELDKSAIDNCNNKENCSFEIKAKPYIYMGMSDSDNFIIAFFEFAERSLRSKYAQLIKANDNEWRWERDYNNISVNKALYASHYVTKLVKKISAEQIPTLIIRGSDDKHGAHLEGYYRLFPNLKLVTLNNQGHVLDKDKCNFVLPAWSFVMKNTANKHDDELTCKEILKPIENDGFKGYFTSEWKINDEFSNIIASSEK